MNKFLRSLWRSYTCVDSYVEHPLFEYVFERKATNKSDSLPAGRIEILKEIYGLAFRDLKLPLEVKYDGQPITINGMFTLPALTGEREVTIDVSARKVLGNRLIVLSNLTEDGTLKEGAVAAKIIIHYDEGGEKTFVLRKGVETESDVAPKIVEI